MHQHFQSSACQAPALEVPWVQRCVNMLAAKHMGLVGSGWWRHMLYSGASAIKLQPKLQEVGFDFIRGIHLVTGSPSYVVVFSYHDILPIHVSRSVSRNLKISLFPSANLCSINRLFPTEPAIFNVRTTISSTSSESIRLTFSSINPDLRLWRILTHIRTSTLLTMTAHQQCTTTTII